jgi:hypothetical protein
MTDGVVAPARSAPRRRRRILLALASVAVALVLAEAVVRWRLGPRYAPVYRLNDTWLYDYVPGAHRLEEGLAEEGGGPVAFDIDSDGFRGPELRPRGAGRRVVVYGDSFIAARNTPFERTFVARLGRELGEDVEAIDAGVSGYGPDQVLLRMESELPRLAPDLVVVAVFADNDYGDLVRNRLFELDESGGLRRGRPVIGAAMRRWFDDARSSLVLPKLFRALREGPLREESRQAGARVEDDLVFQLGKCRRQFDAAVVRHDDEVMNCFWDTPDADVRLEPASPSARYKIALLTQVLASIRDTAKRADVPLVFVVIPSPSDVCEGYAGAADPARWPAWRADNETAPIVRAAFALGVPCVDLFDVFRAQDANALFRHGGDDHWNAAGQQVAAKATARRIGEAGLLR